jgi:tetratricopeptide (TPR) repeat protein
MISTTLPAVALLMAACGPPAVPDEPITIVPEIQDIPGVNPQAVSAFNDGIMAMEETPTNYSAALTAFTRAFSIDADFWEALENIGLLQMDLGQYADAAATFEAEAALIDELITREWPVAARPEVHLNIGKAYALAGRTNEAAQAFARLLEIDPDNVEARANLAALNLQSNNLDGSRAYIAELLEMSRNDVGALNVLALTYKRGGDMQMAEYLWENSLGLIAVQLEAMEDEAQYEELTEDEAELLRNYNAGRRNRMIKVQSDINNELGVIAWNSGDHDEAESFYYSAVSLNPSNAAAQANLATVYLDYADFEMACVHYDEALALRPRDENAMVGKGSCLYGMGDVDGAFSAFEAASAAHPENDYILERLGFISFSDRNDLAATVDWLGRNLQVRGLTESTCNRGTDAVCATVNTAIELQQQGTP